MKNVRSFIYSSKKKFPKDECTIQDKMERNVYNSDQIYEVLYIDLNEKLKKHITYAKPYICKEDNGKITYGWCETETNAVLCNIENSCRLDSVFVVGFVKTVKEVLSLREAEFEFYKRKIDEQWE